MADSIVSASEVYVATVATGNSTVSASEVYVATKAIGNSTISASFLYVAITPIVIPYGGGRSVPGTRAANTTSQSTVPGTRAANTVSQSSRGGGGQTTRSAAAPNFNPQSRLSEVDGTVGYVQWRAYIGPPFRKSTDSDFWDWSALTLAAYTPISDNTLSSGVAFGGTVANLTSAASFPSAGGLWLGPNATGESWGYATYTGKSTNQLTGLTRDTVDVEYSGVHTSGAVARFWWPLDTATAEPVLRETMDATQSSVAWDLQLSGISSPVPALRATHLVLVQTREISGATWGSWTNYLIGWTMGHTMKDNAEKERPWTLNVSSVHGMLSQIEVTGLKVGPPDLADNANITVSSTLSPAYKEGNTGEFTSSNPNISADSMADNSVSTPWISGGFVGEDNVFPTSAQVLTETLNGLRENYGITQFHVSKYAGQSSGYRWIEVDFFGASVTGASLVAGWDYYVNFDGSYILNYGIGDKIILAENPTLFTEENPDNHGTVLDLANYQLWSMGNEKYTVDMNGATGGTFTLTVGANTTAALAYNATAATVQAALIGLASVGTDNARVTKAGAIFTVTFVNGRGSANGPGMTSTDSTTGGAGIIRTQTAAPNAGYDTAEGGENVFTYIDPAGGMLRMLFGALYQWQSQVVWGTYEPFAALDYTTWTGSALAAITAGQTARMLFFPTAPATTAEFWEVGKVATPGYNVKAAVVGPPAVVVTTEWVYLNLPTMGLTLNADIDDTVTTIVIAKEDSVSVDGLPATGTIQIGLEQITYTAINRTTGTVSGGARGANSTTAVVHTLGDTIYFVNSGVATEAYPIDTIQIERPTGFSVPRDFVIRGSELSTARGFGDANYQNDYTTHATVTNNTATSYSLDLSATAPRIRYLLIEVTKMSEIPSRVKINELRVLIDGDVLDSSKFLATGTIAEAMDKLILAAGIPAAATSGTTTGNVTEYTTETNVLWPVLVDLAAFTNRRITIGRDSKIVYSDDAFWSISGTPAETSEFTRTEAAYVEVNKTPVRNVGQVVLTWRSFTSDAEENVSFPATYTSGRKVKIGPYVYADAAAALAGATKRYYQMRRPYDVVVELAQQGDGIRAGTIRGLNWQLHDSQLASDRTYIALQSAHTIKNFGWNSVLTLLQLNRTDEQ